jgi:hypothetical protein
LKRAKIFLGLLVTLVLTLSVAMGALVVAETPSGANNNNVQMSLSGIPIQQEPGENVNYYMTVSNPQSSSPLYSANAQNLVVTFYPSQADGTPSASGTVVGTIPSLAVDGAAIAIGPVTYPMPTLNPGVTAAVSRAVLSGTILLGESGLSFNITKQVSIELRTEPVGGTAFPVDKLGLVAPWVGLAGLVGALTLLMLRKRRQA